MITRFCLICIFLCGTCSTKAQSLLQTADTLFSNGDYLAASVAYERVLFAETDPFASFSAAVGKTRCLNQQGRYVKAIAFLNGQIQLMTIDSLRYRLRYEQVLCAYLAGQFENALSLADRLAYLHPDQTPSSVLMVIRILSLNELQRWPEAAELYSQLVKVSQTDSADAPYEQLPKLKSVKKAQWLSTFIPGGGQFYAGKLAEAMLSILVQSAGLYFGAASFLQGYYLSAWGVGAALFGSFHAGGIRRAEVLTNQYNQRKIQAFNQQVKEQVIKMANQTSH